MTWTHIPKSRELMLTEQWIFRTRAANIPACSLKRDEEIRDAWRASILNRNGISTVSHYILAPTTLNEAQRVCEIELEKIGWST